MQAGANSQIKRNTIELEKQDTELEKQDAILQEVLEFKAELKTDVKWILKEIVEIKKALKVKHKIQNPEKSSSEHSSESHY